jgi:SpoVK/Ycf46/Vps4 family AAA+-type ATPase
MNNSRLSSSLAIVQRVVKDAGKTVMDEKTDIEDKFVQLARLALSGREQDIETYIRRVARASRPSKLEFSESLTALLRSRPSRRSPMRNVASNMVEATPVDVDTRLELVRHEIVHDPDLKPIWSTPVKAALDQLLSERMQPDALADAGLLPTRSALLTGDPGVGKTLAARWLARELQVPLLILDLAAVMSSFLGKTGANLRKVLDYAKTHPCVLLLDEVDAVAKRRDDESEIGELKRLVTVLLQEVDDWPPSGLLLAATNHPALLDPAVWRRFELVIDFPLPAETERTAAITQFLDEDFASQELIVALSAVLHGRSFSEIERDLMNARRRSVLRHEDLDIVLLQLIQSYASSMSFGDKRDLAADLISAGHISQRRASEAFGISRDSLRKAATSKGDNNA